MIIIRINHNISAQRSYNQYYANQSQSQKALEKLSSGSRINRAADDAAGLSISQKMRAQIRGLDQASRNIQDGISMIQVAEGGLQEVHALLMRGRELSVQAATDTNTVSDKQAIQQEMGQLLKEIDRISRNTEFNTINLLNQNSMLPGSSEIITNLKNSWLKQSIDRIQTYYGITPDNVDLDINIIQGSPGGVAASVGAWVTGLPGVGVNLSLNIELADYSGGNIGGLSADRTIAHEMVHAVMARTMNWSESVNGLETSGISTWFREGTAEFIHGADERVSADLGVNNQANRQALVNQLGAAGTPWVSDTAHYSAAYVAIRYMHERIQDAGGTGIDEVISYLAGNPTRTLDQAILFVQAAHGADPVVSTWNGVAGFKTDFAANGEDFIEFEMNLLNTDTGAIGGADEVGAGLALTDTTVIDDTINAGDPTPFNELYPTSTAQAKEIQVGANSGQTMAISLSNVESSALGLSSVDMINGASNAIDIFDSAIDTVSSERSRLGAAQNRLEHILTITVNSHENMSASESRIRDTDMAREMMSFTKSNILGQASSAMIAQANQTAEGVLQLLRVG